MDMNPALATLAAASNPQYGSGGASPAMSPDLMQQLMAGQYDPSAVTGASADPSTSLAQTQLAPGKPSARASLNVQLPQRAPQGPPPTPDAQVPQGPPPTPNAQVPQGPPPTPNAPQGPAAPPPQRDPLISQMIDPSRVMRPVAAAGRNGDSMLAHVTPGEQIVPSQIMAMHPELRQAIDAAFAMHGGNRRTHQVGHPASNANPATGLPEFAFNFGSLLPLLLAAGGSMFLGPEVLAPMMGLEGATGVAGALPGMVGGALGGFAGNEITNPGAGVLHNLAGPVIGSAVGGVAGSLLPNVGAGANAAAGAGANTTAGAGANAAASTPVGNPLPGQYGPPLSAAPAAAAGGTSSPGFFDNLLSGKGLLRAGTGLAGGMVGDMFADQFFPAKNAGQTSDQDTGDSHPQLSQADIDQIRRLTSRRLNMPSNDYLQTYGASPSTPPVSFFGYA